MILGNEYTKLDDWVTSKIVENLYSEVRLS